MMHTARLIGVATLAFVVLLRAAPADAATFFASPQFAAQWDQGEAIAPNFWGPLATARDGQLEAYAGASSGPICAPGAVCLTIAYLNQRTVQYFDKGRMELTNGSVTNGLLATEMFRGQMQVGDTAFQPKASPTIPIAGDPDNPGPTYAGLGTAGAFLFAAAAPIPLGATVTTTVDAGGNMVPGGNSVNSATTIAAFDAATKHNVPGGFAQYRERAGIAAIGYAISEPFLAKVKVAGAGRLVMVQVFERRVLTYTAENPDPYKVEMGNIGQHYYRWRYPNGVSPAGTVSGDIALSPITLSTVLIANHGSSGIVSFTSSLPACLTTEVRVIGTTNWLADPNATGCTPGTTLTTTVTLATGDKVEVRGVARDAAGTVTVYTPNAVTIDTTVPPSS